MDNRHSLSLKASPLATRNPNEPNKSIIVLVGLPARGKTYISKKLARYLNWIGIKTRVFNVGDYRRKFSTYSGHEFFSENNETACKIRTQAANQALDDMLDWLDNKDGEIAVFDATNSTRSRRTLILESCFRFNVIFIESICDNDELIHSSILEVKVKSPDYVDMPCQAAVDDFLSRIQHYKNQYEPIDDKLDETLSYIKIFDQGQRYLVNRIEGTLNSRIVYYLMNMRVAKRTIYITRHGESEYNVTGKLGGDSDLSSSGIQYAQTLAEYIKGENLSNFKVWTSHLKRTRQTAAYIDCDQKESWKALNEIDAGYCENLSYQEVQERYPQDFAMRDKDKFNFRYPMGESYQDLVWRLEPVIMELEHQSCVVLICHQAVARCLLAYYMEQSHAELPYIKVPLHTVFKLTPTAYQTVMEAIPLDVPAVDTHREKPDRTEIGRSTNEALKTVPFHY